MCRWETFAKYNKRVGWNKCVGGKLLPDVINVQDEINVQVSNYLVVFSSIQAKTDKKKEIFDPKFAPQSNYGFKKNEMEHIQVILHLKHEKINWN